MGADLLRRRARAYFQAAKTAHDLWAKEVLQELARDMLRRAEKLDSRPALMPDHAVMEASTKKTPGRGERL